MPRKRIDRSSLSRPGQRLQKRLTRQEASATPVGSPKRKRVRQKQLKQRMVQQKKLAASVVGPRQPRKLRSKAPKSTPGAKNISTGGGIKGAPGARITKRAEILSSRGGPVRKPSGQRPSWLPPVKPATMTPGSPTQPSAPQKTPRRRQPRGSRRRTW